MKKILLLPILAIGLMASQAWGAPMCLWDNGGCWPNPPANCATDGWLFNGGEEGEDTFCAGGTFTGQGKTSTPPTGAVPAIGCCLWNTKPSGHCFPVFNETDATSCSGGANKYWAGGACPAKNGEWYNCPTSTPTYDGASKTALGCCKWADGSNKCWTIYSGPDPDDGVDGADKVTTCKGGSNQFWAGACPAPGDGTCPSSSPSSSSTGGSSSSTGGSSSSGNNNTPIISHNSAPVVGLNVVSFARSLKVASGKDATVSLFDIHGKQVFGQKVFSGTTIISLEGQKQGVYYAVVKSGAQKQTVKVVLK